MMQIHFKQEEFSKEILEWVKSRGYRNSALESGIAVGTWFIIANREGFPTMDTFVKLCEVMQVEPNQFFEIIE